MPSASAVLQAGSAAAATRGAFVADTAQSRMACPARRGRHQPIVNTMCSGCPVVIVELCSDTSS